MSDRERWIIYPLLFFSFTLSARDTVPYFKPAKFTFQRVVCHELEVKSSLDVNQAKFRQLTSNEINSAYLTALSTNSMRVQANQVVVESPDGDERVQLGGDKDHIGQVLVFGPDDKLAVSLGSDPDHAAGYLQLLDPQSNPVLEMGATNHGGMIRVIGKQGNPTLLLGHEGKGTLSGLFAADEQGSLVVQRFNGNVVPWGVPLVVTAAQESDDDKRRPKEAEDNLPKQGEESQSSNRPNERAPAATGETDESAGSPSDPPHE